MDLPDGNTHLILNCLGRKVQEFRHFLVPEVFLLYKAEDQFAFWRQAVDGLVDHLQDFLADEDVLGGGVDLVVGQHGLVKIELPAAVDLSIIGIANVTGGDVEIPVQVLEGADPDPFLPDLKINIGDDLFRYFPRVDNGVSELEEPWAIVLVQRLERRFIALREPQLKLDNIYRS